MEPRQFPSLNADLRKRAVGFLLRWQAFGDALACLDALQMDDLATVQDWRAQALQGEGRLQEAVRILEQRTLSSAALTPRLQLARLYLAAGDTGLALEIARNLTAGDGGMSSAWILLGDVYVQMGDLDKAEELFLRQARLAPASRQPVLGLMQVHWRRGHLVTAAAYAVQVLSLEEGAPDLSVPQLTELRTFFEAANDPNRVREINQRLVDRFDRELAELHSLLEDELSRLIRIAGAPRSNSAPRVWRTARRREPRAYAASRHGKRVCRRP